jgi:hypothetical protein
MVTHGRRLLAGLLVLGAALAATPVHAAPPRNINPNKPPVYPPLPETPTPGGPTITLTPDGSGYILSGSGFTPRTSAVINIYDASYQLHYGITTGLVPAPLSYCTLTGCETVVPGGTIYLRDLYTGTCITTANVIAEDVRGWSNWVQAHYTC